MKSVEKCEVKWLLRLLGWDLPHRVDITTSGSALRRWAMGNRSWKPIRDRRYQCLWSGETTRCWGTERGLDWKRWRNSCVCHGRREGGRKGSLAFHNPRPQGWQWACINRLTFCSFMRWKDTIRQLAFRSSPWSRRYPCSVGLHVHGWQTSEWFIIGEFGLLFGN